MKRRLIGLLALVPIAVAAWLTFTAPAVPALSLDEVMLFPLPDADAGATPAAGADDALELAN